MLDSASVWTVLDSASECGMVLDSASECGTALDSASECGTASGKHETP